MIRPELFIACGRTSLFCALCVAGSVVLPQETLPTAATPTQLHRIDPQTPQGLQDLFQYNTERLPFVIAHRGGAQAGYPENCLATFENTLRHTYAAMEIDPRYTKDSAIVLIHDASLERTTTGKGRVADWTLQELKQLRLKDTAGNVTSYQLVTLDETLEWARGRTILVLDQKDVPLAERVRKIAEHKAEAYALLIVYSFKDAQTCYAMNANIMMEVMVPSLEKVADFDKTGVPWRNVAAFVGHSAPQDPRLYASIHGKGTSCIVGTSRNLDRQFAENEAPDVNLGLSGYRQLLAAGADLIETDCASRLGPALLAASPASATKQKYMRGK